MEEITEYQKSAALMAHDIDVLYECAKNNPENALVFFERLREARDKTISDENYRNSRYSSMCNVFSVARSLEDATNG